MAICYALPFFIYSGNMIGTEKLTRQYIEQYVDQISIFAKFMNISESEILDCINKGNLIRSPLRDDKHPTCGFYYSDGKLRFNDFAGYFHGDCYDVVGYQHLLNSRDSKDFNIILELIAKEFKLHKYKDHTIKLTSDKYYVNLVKDKKVVLFNVEIRDWIPQDVTYWKQFYIGKEQLDKFKVFPIYSYWMNGNLQYSFSYGDLCYGYYEGLDNKTGIERWQFYHPFRKEARFITNYAGFRGTAGIRKNEFGIITKSVKDVMVLDLFGIPSTSVAAEGILPSQTQMKKLSNYWSKIYTLTDFDLTGIRAGNKMKRIYNTKPLFLFNGRFQTFDYKGKDIAEVIKHLGYNKTYELIQYLKEEIDNLDFGDYFDFLNNLYNVKLDFNTL